MEYLVIVYGASSAYLYVQEAWLRGMVPIVVYPPKGLDTDEIEFKNRVGDEAEYIYMKEEPETDPEIDSLKLYNVVCVVAGGEYGVHYADRIAARLGMKCNDPETIYKRNTKSGMHQALKDAGIRYIRSIIIKNAEDIREFWKENSLKKGIMKFAEGSGSFGDKVVHSPEEAMEHYDSIKDLPNQYGIVPDILLQEFIEGDEYIVDTVSCNGKHMVTDVWKYNKILSKDDKVVNEAGTLVTNLDGEIYELVKYAFKVMTATGFVYGPCHGEYKIDDKGPVLIETNARPIGLSMKREYLDECLGHHVADIALDSYLNPERFEQYRLKPYRPLKYAKIKLFINYSEGEANLKPLSIIIEHMKSFRHTHDILADEIIHIPKTTDLHSSPITVKMCHKDKSILDMDYELLRTVEKYPDIACEYETKSVKVETDWKSMFDYIARERKTLVVTNDDRYSIWFGKKEKVGDNWDSYDNMIYAYTEGKKLSDVYTSFLKDAAMVRDGGTIIVIPEFKKKMPYGSIGVQILLQLSGCTLNMPLMGLEDYMIATKFSS